ncbi:hypothetical protein P7K49_005794 [Saguinus oedipus]|uniref:Uncharacterized protein n=1 Tax=Saguinus oedipus TaxID=9490 RepID=A0ABQ9W0K8_SAGOE|nr:hypothetical protein P7K49_005794 [Saguinus oedipus]
MRVVAAVRQKCTEASGNTDRRLPDDLSHRNGGLGSTHKVGATAALRVPVLRTVTHGSPGVGDSRRLFPPSSPWGRQDLPGPGSWDGIDGAVGGGAPSKARLLLQVAQRCHRLSATQTFLLPVRAASRPGCSQAGEGTCAAPINTVRRHTASSSQFCVLGSHRTAISPARRLCL